MATDVVGRRPACRSISNALPLSSFRGQAILLALAALLTLSCGDSATTPEGGCPGPAEGCTLRELATSAGVRIGAGAAVARLVRDDPEYAEAMARHFNALTPNAELKWQATQPERDTVRFEGADLLVAFAEGHGMEVRGHTLVWAHEDFYDVLPQYVNDVTDAALLREVTREHVNAVMDHYRGRIHRYDVVNEPLTIGGDALHENVYRQLLGDRWVSEVFRMASEADPDAELWLNENLALSGAGKADTLYDLVAEMVADGVPIDGIGFQGHFLGGAPDPAHVEATVRRFADLGLKVAITEMDIPTPDGPGGAEQQRVDFYETIAACLRVHACEEVTFWGISDKDSWLNGFLGRPVRPLPLDDEYRVKPAYQGVRDALAMRLGRG